MKDFDSLQELLSEYESIFHTTNVNKHDDVNGGQIKPPNHHDRTRTTAVANKTRTTTTSRWKMPTSYELYQMGWILHNIYVLGVVEPKTSNTLPKNNPNHLTNQYNNNMNDHSYNNSDVMDTYRRIQESVRTVLKTIPFQYRQQMICNELYQTFEEDILLGINHNEIVDVSSILKSFQCMNQLFQCTSIVLQSIDWSERKIQLYVSFYKKYIILQQNLLSKSNDNNNNNMKSLSSVILQMLHCILFHQDDIIVPFELLLQSIQQLQIDESTIWEDMIDNIRRYCSVYHLTSKDWIDNVVNKYYNNDSNIQHDMDQIEYVQSMMLNAITGTEQQEQDHLRAAAVKNVTTSSTTKVSSLNSTGSKKIVSNKEDVLQRMVDEIRGILPNFGEGFIETALSFTTNHTTEETVALLLLPKNEWPATLQIIDPQLPRRKRQFGLGTQKADEIEAKINAKLTIQALQKQQEQEAMLLDQAMRFDNNDDDDDNNNITNQLSSGNNNHHDYPHEYDDDYDDQYDNIEAGDGDVRYFDNALYDVYDINHKASQVASNANAVSVKEKYKPDTTNNNQSDKRRGGGGTNNKNNHNKDQEYQAIKVYNKVVKDIVADQQYWESNRNTNRRVNTKNTTASSQSEEQDNQGTAETKQQQTNHDNKKYRGPDKIKGGRIPKANMIPPSSSTGNSTVLSPTDSGQQEGGNQKNDSSKSVSSSSTNVTTGTPNSIPNTMNNNNKPPVKNSRQKINTIAKRRDKQKDAMYKKSG